MSRKEELKGLTVKILREEAKKLNIVGRWEMSKTELIESIVEAENAKNSKSAKDENAIDSHKVEGENKVKESTNQAIDMEQKRAYIEQAPIGALIAFRLKTGKVKTAKITKRSISKKLLKVETEYKAEYFIPFDDVLWVRTGNRWPRGVYNLLKGIKEDGEKTTA